MHALPSRRASFGTRGLCKNSALFPLSHALFTDLSRALSVRSSTMDDDIIPRTPLRSDDGLVNPNITPPPAMQPSTIPRTSRQSEADRWCSFCHCTAVHACNICGAMSCNKCESTASQHCFCVHPGKAIVEVVNCAGFKIDDDTAEVIRQEFAQSHHDYLLDFSTFLRNRTAILSHDDPPTEHAHHELLAAKVAALQRPPASVASASVLALVRVITTLCKVAVQFARHVVPTEEHFPPKSTTTAAASRTHVGGVQIPWKGDANAADDVPVGATSHDRGAVAVTNFANVAAVRGCVMSVFAEDGWRARTYEREWRTLMFTSRNKRSPAARLIEFISALSASLRLHRGCYWHVRPALIDAMMQNGYQFENGAGHVLVWHTASSAEREVQRPADDARRVTHFVGLALHDHMERVLLDTMAMLADNASQWCGSLEYVHILGPGTVLSGTWLRQRDVENLCKLLRVARRSLRCLSLVRCNLTDKQWQQISFALLPLDVGYSSAGSADDVLPALEEIVLTGNSGLTDHAAPDLIRLCWAARRTLNFLVLSATQIGDGFTCALPDEFRRRGALGAAGVLRNDTVACFDQIGEDASVTHWTRRRCSIAQDDAEFERAASAPQMRFVCEPSEQSSTTRSSASSSSSVPCLSQHSISRTSSESQPKSSSSRNSDGPCGGPIDYRTPHHFVRVIMLSCPRLSSMGINALVLTCQPSEPRAVVRAFDTCRVAAECAAFTGVCFGVSVGQVYPDVYPAIRFFRIPASCENVVSATCQPALVDVERTETPKIQVNRTKCTSIVAFDSTGRRK